MISLEKLVSQLISMGGGEVVDDFNRRVLFCVKSSSTLLPNLHNLKIEILSYFWSLVVCKKPAWLPQVKLTMRALRLSHSGSLRTQ